MPSLTFSQLLTANQLGFNPLDGWQYEFVPIAWANGAVAKLLVTSTDVNVRMTVYSGAQTIQERAPVQGSGTAGLIPSDLNTSPQTWVAMPNDRLKLSIDEVAGGTPTVQGIIIIEPAG